MKYFEKKERTYSYLDCNHPKVARFWKHGGQVPNSKEMVCYYSFVMSDGSRHDFKDNGDESALKEAELFLDKWK